jgi:hypothetical protein
MRAQLILKRFRAGLTGAVLGGGYGADKTKAECGTVLGGVFNTSPIPAVIAAR